MRKLFSLEILGGPSTKNLLTENACRISIKKFLSFNMFFGADTKELFSMKILDGAVTKKLL